MTESEWLVSLLEDVNRLLRTTSLHSSQDAWQQAWALFLRIQERHAALARGEVAKVLEMMQAPLGEMILR